MSDKIARASLVLDVIRSCSQAERTGMINAMKSHRPQRLWAWLLCALATVPTSHAADSAPVGREHWAFKPLTDQRPPVVQLMQWPRSTIDSFVLARLEAENLRPAPDADRRTLVRRIFIQLIGLPPTPSSERRNGESGGGSN